MFYFWNVDQLVKDLRAGIVTEYEKMGYLFYTALFQLFAFQQSGSYLGVTPYELIIKWLFFWVQLGILIWGFRYCFAINQKNDNKNFIERFVCLGLPVSIRLGVYFLIGTLVASALIALIGTVVFPKLLPSLVEFTNANNVAVVVNSNELLTNLNPVLKKALLSMKVIQYLVSILISILFFVLLGRKIDAVGKP